MIGQQLAEGYDYVKVMIEDGTVVGHPGLTVISDDVLTAAVREAHRHGKLAIAHATPSSARGGRCEPRPRPRTHMG